MSLSPSSKLGILTGYVLILVLLGTTDAILTRNMPPEGRDTTNDVIAADPLDDPEPASPPPTGVAKQEGPDIFDIFNRLQLATETTDETSLLARAVPANQKTESRVLLQDNDRLAFIAWTESPDVKTYFLSLKEALTTAFSSELQDLVDEVQEREGKPTRNVLSFFDPGIHEERVLFFRVRQRLYEFHITPGKEPMVQELMDALTE